MPNLSRFNSTSLHWPNTSQARLEAMEVTLIWRGPGQSNNQYTLEYSRLSFWNVRDGLNPKDYTRTKRMSPPGLRQEDRVTAGLGNH